VLGLCHREMWESPETMRLCFTITSLCSWSKVKELPNAKTFTGTLLSEARVFLSKSVTWVVVREMKAYRYG